MYNLSKTLISLLTLQAYRHFDKSITDERLESMTRQLIVSLDATRSLTKIDLDSCREDDGLSDDNDHDDDDDDDDDDAALDDTDEESGYGISFYLNLLMNLSPSMEQVYSQIMKDAEATARIDAEDRSMPYTAQPLQLSMVAEGKKPLGRSYSTSPSTLTDRAVCKNLQERFFLVMQERSKHLNKKLWPKIPTPPLERSGVRFQEKLHKRSEIPLEYKNSAVLDEALSVIPLNDIYLEAEDEKNLILAEALSLGPGERPQWGYQDCVIRALLRYAVLYSSNHTP